MSGSSGVVLGIDVGALTAKAVLVNGEGEILASGYDFHRGSPITVLGDLLAEVADGYPIVLATTGAGADLCPHHDEVHSVNSVRASIAGVRRLFPEARNILDIGGASLTLIRLDPRGKFRSYAANSACAAGTGSFLDEQAMRLGLTYEDISTMLGPDAPPSVATRCAVFAKSDLIHLQQSGASREEMWAGLCRGMASTALQTLLKGKPLGGPSALVGGVAQNKEVRRWLRASADSTILTGEQAHLAAAYGAALVVLEAGVETSQREGHGASARLSWRDWLGEDVRGATYAPVPSVAEDYCCDEDAGDAGDGSTALLFGGERAHAPLRLDRTEYPSFDVAETYTDDEGNEVRITRWAPGARLSGTLGIDIGSTSTKACLIDEAGSILVDVYRKTAGDPIGATKKLFDALRHAAAARQCELDVLGCGTTGSGRKLVGAVVGADAVVNEISAHVAGAMHVDPEIETIFEIGGQDSKYMRARNGAITDANMNYVCAAGTGSFVEEQARKLGIPLEQVGDLVMNAVPPPSSDRCTVFMEQDVNKLLRSGRTAAQAMAAVMRSVVQNYLNKVVGNRPYSRSKIAFQGATARNKGLVAAFETLLGVEMVVSPYCHVMGAWGVALLTQARLRKEQRSTTFAGLDLSQRNVELRRERCDMCDNYCEISFARIEGMSNEPSWGYLCGREPGDTKMRVLHEYDAFRRRRRWLHSDGKKPTDPRQAKAAAKAKAAGKAKWRPVVGLPVSLAAHSHLPMWQRLLEELGAMVVVPGDTERDAREIGGALSGAEFCFPVKVGHGLAAQAVDSDELDYVFMPQFVAQPRADTGRNTFLCPYVQAFPVLARTALSMAGRKTDHLLTPMIDRRMPLWRQAQCLHEVLGPALNVSRRRVRQALRVAEQAQHRFEQRCLQAGLKALSALERDIESGDNPRPGIVIVGRPYNVSDSGLNLDLPRKIAEMGYRVIPLDLLPYEPERIPERYRTVFWAYGLRILSALQYVRDRQDLFAVYLTNFSCGPDSFLMSYAEEIMGDKPMLSLELDEHGADAGYITRIEAFLDVVRTWEPRAQSPLPAEPQLDFDELRTRRIWMPPMHAVGTDLIAAAFKGDGYDAQPLPSETAEDLELGQRVVRGCECLPMRTTIGAFLNAVERDTSGKKHALFMPTASGPCRFGQYATLYRQILDRRGQSDTLILSPSSENTYAGLSQQLRRRLWQVILVADLLYKMTLRVRPYEATAGDADEALGRWTRHATRAFETVGDCREVIRRAGEAFSHIPVRQEQRPLVGVVGEIYVRNNEFSNESLVRAIEQHGGEAWMTPLSEWILFTAVEAVRKFVDLPKTIDSIISHGRHILKSRFLNAMEAAYYRAAGPLLAGRHEPAVVDTIVAGMRYLPFNVGGEALLTLGRSVHFVRQGAALVVNASPFSCMAGTVCAALFSRMESELQVPIVSPFYDGNGEENRRIGVFLANTDVAAARSGPPAINPKVAEGRDRTDRHASAG